MELFLRAIESSNGEDDSLDDLETTQNEPILSFAHRPPQWCIVDKWFTMQVNCTDKNISELEAFVYNSEGNVLHDVLQPEHTNDKEGKRLIVSIDPTRKAIFRLRFVNGSKGAWLHIGIHKVKQPEKCLLKSPPIKVQTNRSKRPRDNKRKPTPIVNSLSPSTVPSTGNFPGRKDRMLLIFGSNFYLWGNSPVVHLKYNDNEATEIRPPNLIWWSENLMECQLPECNQDIEVKVANYDMVFGDGKTLKVLKAINDEEPPPKPLASTTDCLVTSSQFVLDYTPCAQGARDIDGKAKVILSFKEGKQDRLRIETPQGQETIRSQNLLAVLKGVNKGNNETLFELSQRSDSSSSNSIIFSFALNLPMQKILTEGTENVFISAYLKKENSGQHLLDPTTKQIIVSEKPLFISLEDEDEDMPDLANSQEQSQTLQVSANLSALATVSLLPPPQISEDVRNYQSSILFHIKKCDNFAKLTEWENMLNDTMRQLTEHRQKLLSKPVLPNSSSPLKQDNSKSSLDPKENGTKKVDLRASIELDDDDEPSSKRGKLAPNESKQEVSLAIPDPKQKNGVVYWKFFNPGNRTFLELTEGKLQIIGSRRIQMLIESVPPNAKFVSAHLFVQKNDTYEAIENCSRCKENGIPNVFCVLPRRGREHDFPWITFRITCTSTAKHWKGSLFWIGAEFLLDPTAGTMMKVFSPPIHVQSKVKSKDLANSLERLPSKESIRPLGSESPSPSPPLRNSGTIPNPNSGNPPTTLTVTLLQPQPQPVIQLQSLGFPPIATMLNRTPLTPTSSSTSPQPSASSSTTSSSSTSVSVGTALLSQLSNLSSTVPPATLLASPAPSSSPHPPLGSPVTDSSSSSSQPK